MPIGPISRRRARPAGGNLMKVSKNYGILDMVLVTTRFSNFKEFWKNGILPARNEATHRVIAPAVYRLRRRRAARRAGHGRELCRDPLRIGADDSDLAELRLARHEPPRGSELSGRNGASASCGRTPVMVAS